MPATPPTLLPTVPPVAPRASPVSAAVSLLVPAGSSADSAVRRDRMEKIALFRYQLIRAAADSAVTTRQRGPMVRDLAAMIHPGPFGGTVTVSKDTIDRWIRAKLSSLVSLLKHPAFEDEREVRYVEGAIGREVNFRATSRGIVPYLELSAVEFIQWNDETLEGDEVARLPIQEVVVGPGAGPGACVSLQRFLASNGYGDIDPRISTIPLRR